MVGFQFGSGIIERSDKFVPRKNRNVFNEGLYHVINRGNYRSNVLENEGANIGFEKCFFEADFAFARELQAYSVMSNYFHLCVAAPLGNLSKDMRRL